MSNFKKVKNFMETFRQDVKNKPSFPSEKIISLRCSLIEEELSELKENYYWILVGIAIGLAIYLGDKYVF